MLLKPTGRNFDNFVNNALKYLKKEYKKLSDKEQKTILIKAIVQIDKKRLNSKHGVILIKKLLNCRKNYLKSDTKNLNPSYFSHKDNKTINQINNYLTYISTTNIQTYVDVAHNEVLTAKYNKAFSNIIGGIDNYLNDRFPMLKKEKRIKIEINIFKRLLGSKDQAEILLANKDYQILSIQAQKTLVKLLRHFNIKNNRAKKSYIHNLCLIGYHNFKRHQRNFRIAEYIIIPLIIFALPDIVSDILTLVVGGFFKFIGTGVMMYAQHFMDIEAIPRLILAVIADGIAYAINRKRDE